MELVSYIRVSTKRQGQSGLGLLAQQEMIERYSKAVGGTVLREFREVETGKTKDRPQLLAALEYCRLTGARLVIAKLDRLSRSVAFTSYLMESKVDFVACDNPHANRLTIQIMAVVAEHEATMISERTKAALARSSKKAGRASPSYGTGKNTLDESERSERLLRGSQKGSEVSARVRSANSKAYFQSVRPFVEKMREEGLTYRAIADKLNAEKIKTSTGGQWVPSRVLAVLRG